MREIYKIYIEIWKKSESEVSKKSWFRTHFFLLSAALANRTKNSFEPQQDDLIPLF